MRIPRLILVCLCLAAAVSVSGQPKTLNNEAVLKMKAAGLDDGTIVKVIEASPGEYDISADGLIALKAGGVGETVLAAIINHARMPATQALAPARSADGYPQELGVYYLKENAYIALEPEIMNIRTTNTLATAYSFGAKAMKYNGWITGQHSKNAFGSETRTFFLDIPEGVAPAEYTILKFKEKGDRREVELARARFSMKTGAPEGSTVHFESEKIDKGKYKVTVDRLSPGEYGFMPPGSEISKNSTSVGKIYSFHVTE
jgi:hypothetical protein